MKLNQALDVTDKIGRIFSKKRKTVRNTLSQVIVALLKSRQANVPQIALHMGTFNGKSYQANLTQVTRFLKSSAFQVDDCLWRCYFKLCFGLLEERGMESKKPIVIAVDATSNEDRFYILSASIRFLGRNIPLYFSMRVYPVKNIKKLEEAFLKELRHLLPRTYQYVIVADRGFGNTRFLDLCEKLGFDYILRTNENWNIKDGYEKLNIKTLEKTNQDLKNIYLEKSGKNTRLIMSFQDSSVQGWYLLTSLKEASFLELVKEYSRRFHIEKMFQDEKSSGFDIEKSRLEKYDRYKRLLFCVYTAQMLMLFIGDYINDNVDEVKKKFHFHMSIISAFSK